MTTPTREQVVQWAEDSGLKIGQHWNRSNMTTAFMLDFATLARADLEATIAEQEKETEERQADHLKLVEENHELRHQLQASLAREAQLREALLKIELGESENGCITSVRDCQYFAREALAIPSDDAVLREYGAKLVEKISSMTLSTYTLRQIANQIREGTFK